MKISLFIWGRNPFLCPPKTCPLLQALLSLCYQFSRGSLDSSVDLVNTPVVIYPSGRSFSRIIAICYPSGVMVPSLWVTESGRNNTFLVEMRSQGPGRVDYLLQFTYLEKWQSRTRTWIPRPRIWWPLPVSGWTSGGVNQRPFSQGPPSAIAFKESRSNGKMFLPHAAPAVPGVCRLSA